MLSLKKYAALAVLSCGLSGSLVFASTTLKIGQILSDTETQALGPLKAVTVNGRSLKVVATGKGGSAGLPMTTVLNSQGAVGTTFHEVSVVDQPTDKLRGLSGVIGSADAVKYYDAMGVTLLRFATLEQAIQAVERIQAEIPAVKASVVVKFSLPQSN